MQCSNGKMYKNAGGYRYNGDSMRKTLRRLLARHTPDWENGRAGRWLHPISSQLAHPRLWHLNRRSVAGGVAAGLFCGLIPGPFQMLGAGLCAVLFRVNLPIALVTTLYTNPLTIVPLYLVAYALGNLVLTGTPGPAWATLPAAPEFALSAPGAWLSAMAGWVQALGKSLVLGLILLASLLALAGYGAVRLAWRIWLLRAWNERRGHRS